MKAEHYAWSESRNTTRKGGQNHTIVLTQIPCHWVTIGKSKYPLGMCKSEFRKFSGIKLRKNFLWNQLYYCNHSLWH